MLDSLVRSFIVKNITQSNIRYCITLQFWLVHLIPDENLNTQSLLQHITSKNNSNVFTYYIVKSWLKHEADRCHFFSNMFQILRIHHQGVTLCMFEVADVFINVQIVQRQGLAVIFHVVRFSLQVCGLVAGLRVHANQLPIHTPPVLAT
jgi:hypothetical protein